MNSLTSAVAAVVTDDAGRVLLCQQSQGHRRWGLPGGKVRDAESPVHAAQRDIMEETGTDVQLVDLVGIYELTGQGLPDVVVHVFRGRLAAGVPLVNAPGRICRLSWHDPANLPLPMTPTTRVAIVDAAAGTSGVLRRVQRDVEPEIPDADAEPEPDAQPVPAAALAG
jgi:8-oxo-dGTP diphosphatase